MVVTNGLYKKEIRFLKDRKKQRILLDIIIKENKKNPHSYFNFKKYFESPEEYKNYYNQKKKIYRKEYYQKNRERLILKMKEYYKKNRERLILKMKERRQKEKLVLQSV